MSDASVGQELKQARTALRVSLKEITQRTKIQPWVLEALEADRLHVGMSPVYTKGFLRTYAKELRLDPRPLVRRLYPVSESDVRFSGEASSPDGAHGPDVGTSASQPSPTTGPSPSWSTLLDLDWLRDLPWSRIRRLGLVTVGLVGLMIVTKGHPLGWLATHLPHEEASVALIRDPVKPSTASLGIQPTQPLELIVRARRATWISVRADGRLLTQQQLEVGEEEAWTASQRFEIIVAKPAHVDILLNGQSISPLAMAHQGRLTITHRGIGPLSGLTESP